VSASEDAILPLEESSSPVTEGVVTAIGSLISDNMARLVVLIAALEEVTWLSGDTFGFPEYRVGMMPISDDSDNSLPSLIEVIVGVERRIA
jgi:hypothetical protein